MPCTNETSKIWTGKHYVSTLNNKRDLLGIHFFVFKSWLYPSGHLHFLPMHKLLMSLHSQ